MTIAELIDRLRILLKERSDDSTNYPDRYLYGFIRDARAELLAREYAKFSRVSELNMQTICMPMNLDDLDDCDCGPSFSCKVMKSKYEVPSILTRRGVEIVEVRTFDGKSIMRGHANDMILNQYSKTKKDKIFWSFENGKVVIWNTNQKSPKAIMIKGIFEDPSELSNISLCNSNGEESSDPCFNVTTDSFPIEAKFVQTLIKMSLDLLLISKRLPDDEINNSLDDNG